MGVNPLHIETSNRGGWATGRHTWPGKSLAGRLLAPVLRSHVATDSALLFANTLVVAALGVFFWTLAARLYSLPSVGFSAAVVSAATLVATFANLGLGAVVVRYLPVAGHRGRAISLWATGIPAVAAALIAVAGVAFPVWPLAADLLAGGPQGTLIPAVLAVLTAVMFVQDSIFIARRQARWVLVRGFASSLVRFALLVPLAGAGAYGLMGVYLGGVCVSVAIGAGAWSRPAQDTAAPDTIQPSVREMAKYGSTNYLSGLFAQAPQLLYPVLIASQVSHLAAGAFSFSWMAAAMMLQLPASAANVLMSQLVRNPSVLDERAGRTTRWLLLAMVGLSLIMGVGLALFAGIFLPASAGEITAYLPLLMAGTLPFAWIRMRSMTLALSGDLRSLTLINGVVAVMAVALPLALLPAYGVLGLEVGWVASQTVGVLISVAIGLRHRTGRLTLGVSSRAIFWAYLGLVTAAELVTSLVSLQAGMVFHLSLVAVFIAHGAMGQTEGARRMSLAMTVGPFIRLLSLSLPLSRMSQVAWYPMVSVPLLLGVWYIARQIGVSRRELGLVRGKLPLQVLLAGGGLGLGVLEYVILRPKPLLISYDPAAVTVGALSLLIFTGFNEEVIFRGLLQSLSGPVLGRLGPLYVSLLFGVLHIGYLSVLDVVFVAAVGLVFAYLVRWGGSLVGVTLMHGVTNTVLFIGMPYIVTHPQSALSAVAPWAVGIGVLVALTAAITLWIMSRRHDEVTAQ